MSHTATAPRFRSRGRWSALNIVLMVVGFALFWPLGLAMLAWIIWGDEIQERFEEIRDQIHGFTERASDARRWRPGPQETGNAAFDEYRAQELQRLQEERRKVEAMREEFEAFLAELRRIQDREAFERFMAEYRSRRASADGAAA